jgi:hypothetical protein
MRKGTNNDEELYHNYRLNKWNYNHVDPKQWVEISFVTFFFPARSNIIVNSIISINVTHASKAKTNLDVVNNNFCAL